LVDLSKVVESCGHQLTEKELKAATIELDRSGDGKIKYADLRRWWFTGHRQSSGMKGHVI
jgi:Ca2+-binding EF-hand superfamily protein